MDEQLIVLDEVQEKLIDGLIPFYGKDRGTVLKNIFMLWIEHNIAKPELQMLIDIGGIEGFD